MKWETKHTLNCVISYFLLTFTTYAWVQRLMRWKESEKILTFEMHLNKAEVSSFRRSRGSVSTAGRIRAESATTSTGSFMVTVTARFGLRAPGICPNQTHGSALWALFRFQNSLSNFSIQKKFSITSKYRHIYGVLNIDEIKN
jgi:hypothetical protein